MVGHEDMSVDGAAVARGRLAEPVAIACVVLVGKEDALQVIAALDHMQRLIGDEIAAETGRAVLRGKGASNAGRSGREN